VFHHLGRAEQFGAERKILAGGVACQTGPAAVFPPDLKSLEQGLAGSSAEKKKQTSENDRSHSGPNGHIDGLLVLDGQFEGANLGFMRFFGIRETSIHQSENTGGDKKDGKNLHRRSPFIEKIGKSLGLLPSEQRKGAADWNQGIKTASFFGLG
jgi:hypothetical protein